ncbi:MAG: diadenylate cyclase CdaA [Lachnospiraceae bacterium]|nr:diadenylate cyclase CdaA [Lachnospiraceae bacterium]
MNIDRFVNSVDAFIGDYFSLSIPDIHVTDIVEIAIISVLFYELMSWIKNTRAWMLFRGLLFVLILFFVAAIFQMNTILWLGEKLLNAGLVAVIVVFQPELRHALEQLGRQDFLQGLRVFNFIGRDEAKRFSDKTITELVRAVYDMGSVKTGALIVIEREVGLDEYIRTGIILDSTVSRQLLLNIFEKNTPLHDGAIIIRKNRIVAATCYLPLTDNMELSKDLGTRHRAAVGISEVSDAMVIIVSEETGQVAIAQDSRIIRNVSQEGLTEILKHVQTEEV